MSPISQGFDERHDLALANVKILSQIDLAVLGPVLF